MADRAHLTDKQLDEYEAIAARAADDPFYVSDCEGVLHAVLDRLGIQWQDAAQPAATSTTAR